MLFAERTDMRLLRCDCVNAALSIGDLPESIMVGCVFCVSIDVKSPVEGTVTIEVGRGRRELGASAVFRLGVAGTLKGRDASVALCLKRCVFNGASTLSKTRRVE